jgi:hypothetical protein
VFMYVCWRGEESSLERMKTGILEALLDGDDR